MNHERSCGAVLFTVRDGIPYYVLVQENYYGFPKGHMEAGVDAVIIGDFRKVDRYLLKYKQDTEKTVVYFLAYFEGQEIHYQREELNGAVLVPYEEAVRLVTHVRLKRVLREAHRVVLRWIAKKNAGNSGSH